MVIPPFKDKISSISENFLLTFYAHLPSPKWREVGVRGKFQIYLAIF